MTRMILTRPFLEDLARLSVQTEEAIWEKLKLVEAFPGVGSSISNRMLQRAFGASCLKVTVNGYDIIYERKTRPDDTQENLVIVLGIIAQRTVR